MNILDKDLIVPNHIAIIMDGNGRWATKQGLKRTDGHKEGLKVMGEVARELFDMGVKYLSFYAFSIDNWKRDPKEVQFLTDLIENFYKNEFPKYKDQKKKIVISGVKTGLKDSIIEIIETIQEESKDYDNGVLNICFNYSGRLEIVEACKKIAAQALIDKTIVESLDVDQFYQYLFQKDVPMVDLMIRTSGEQRISDFLIYQNSYAEFYFSSVLWPDFDRKEIVKAIKEYSKRERRFGGVVS